MTPDLLNLPLEIQTALASGYLAYWIAYTGLNRNRSAVDVAFLTFAFGLPAVAAFRLSETWGSIWQVCIAISASLIAGIIWRTIGRTTMLAILHNLRVHQEDGIDNAWTALIQQKNLMVGQLSVHTADGRILYQNNHKYSKAHLGGMYFGADGSIVMVVEEEELPNGVEEIRQGVEDSERGTRVTYIPADQITRVNIR